MFIIWITPVVKIGLKGSFDLLLFILWVIQVLLTSIEAVWMVDNVEWGAFKCLCTQVNNARQGELNDNTIFVKTKTFIRLSKWLIISALSTRALCPMLGSFQELWKRTGIPCLSVSYLLCDRKGLCFQFLSFRRIFWLRCTKLCWVIQKFIQKAFHAGNN